MNDAEIWSKCFFAKRYIQCTACEWHVAEREHTGRYQDYHEQMSDSVRNEAIFHWKKYHARLQG